jgi:hypothetical protein
MQPDHSLTLRQLPGTYAVCRLPPGEAVPPSALHGRFVSITRTADELSVICDEAIVLDDVTAERGFCLLGVQGPLDFNLVGVIAGLTQPLAAATISVFAIATYDTDYLLVRQRDLTRAVEALRQAGYTIILDGGSTNQDPPYGI